MFDKEINSTPGGQRADVLSWQTAPLKENVTITGDIVAHLFASTTGSDSDWVVKLIDVYPADGSKMSEYQLMVANEIFRGRYLNSLSELKRLYRIASISTKLIYMATITLF